MLFLNSGKKYERSPLLSKRLKRKPWIKEESKFILFISPWIVGFLAFFVIPALTSLVYSFSHYNAITMPEWVGLQNYISLLHDPIFLKSLKNTLYFVFIGTPVVISFQILIASLLNFEVKGIAFFRTLYYLPYLVPMVATVIIWRLIFSKSGIINQIVEVVGIGPVDWLGDASLIKPVIITIGMWVSGSGILIFLAALKGVPVHLYDAAKIDGAGIFRRFFHVSLPMISPAILFSVVMQLIFYFQMFTESYILNRGGPNFSSTTYMLHTYKTAFKNLHFGLAMAQAWILFVIILIITIIVMKTSRKWVFYGSGR